MDLAINDLEENCELAGERHLHATKSILNKFAVPL